MRTKKFLQLFTTLIACFTLNSAYAASHHPSFTENKGQWDAHILYKSNLDGGALFLEKDRLTFNFYNKAKRQHGHFNSGPRVDLSDNQVDGHAYQVRFLNCNTQPLLEHKKCGSFYENFYLGSDKNKWRSEVKNYQTIWYRNLYENIDYEISAQSNGFKYNFYVGKQADPVQIQLQYEGVDNLTLHNNTLSYKLSVTDAIELKPYAYQVINGVRKEITCRYVLRNNTVSFDFPEGYNKNLELVIDPVLVFAAQSGSSVDNFGMCATYDAAGNLYAGGTVFGNGYPTTIGAYSGTFNNNPAGNCDIVITKFNATGNSLLYSTYFGGFASELITSMMVDYSNNLCFLAVTSSTDLPMLSNAYDPSFNGGSPVQFLYSGADFVNGTDLYVGKLNANGTSLLGSTYLGGNGNDGLNHVNHLSTGSTGSEYATDSLQFNHSDVFRGELQIDWRNNIYLVSSSRSTNFPTVTAFDNTLGGKQDAVVCKFDGSLSQLLYSTYLGGSANDAGNGLLVTSWGGAVVTGGTCSNDFPTTNSAYKQTYSGGKADAYVSVLVTTSTVLIASTLFGTTDYDQSYFVSQDGAGDIYVFGQSLGNMPVIGPVYNNPNTHQFISKFDPLLASIQLSTVFGSKTTDIDIVPTSFGLDLCNNIYLTGWGGPVVNPANMSNMPLLNPSQSTTDGHDFYLMQLSLNMNTLLYGSYFGGTVTAEHADAGMSRIDKTGTFFQSVCAGCGGFDDFPVTSGAWPNTPGNPNHGPNCNAGMFKIASQASVTASHIIANNTTGCAPLTVNLTNASTNYSTFTWFLPGNVTNSTISNPALTFSVPGSYTVALLVKHPSSCNNQDSSVIYITVPGYQPTVSISGSSPTICAGEATTLTASGASSYMWNATVPGSVLVVYPGMTITYTVTGSNGPGCQNSAMYTQLVDLCTTIENNTIKLHDIFIYPNPADESVTIDLYSGATNVKLIDVYGRTVIEKNIQHKNNILIDLSELAQGIYFVSAEFADGSTVTKKMVRK